MTQSNDKYKELLQCVNENHPSYAPELHIAINAWLSAIANISPEDFKLKGATSRIKEWLKKEAPQFLKKPDGSNNAELTNRIAKICTPRVRKTR